MLALFQLTAEVAPVAAPVAQLGIDSIAPYIRDGGVVAAVAALIYIWRAILRPYLEERDKAQLEAFKGLRDDLREAREDAEKRAVADREAYTKTTLTAMQAVGAEYARAVTDSIGRASERDAAELRRIHEDLVEIRNGAGCSAGAECASPTPLRRSPSQPPVPAWGRRGGTVPPQASPFAAVEADRG